MVGRALDGESGRSSSSFLLQKAVGGRGFLGTNRNRSLLALIICWISQTTHPGLFAKPSVAVAMNAGVPAGVGWDYRRQIIPGDPEIRMRFCLTSLGTVALQEAGKQTCADRISSQPGTEEVQPRAKDKVSLTSITIPPPLFSWSHLILIRALWRMQGMGSAPHFTDEKTETQGMGGTCQSVWKHTTRIFRIQAWCTPTATCCLSREPCTGTNTADLLAHGSIPGLITELLNARHSSRCFSHPLSQ